MLSYEAISDTYPLSTHPKKALEQMPKSISRQVSTIQLQEQDVNRADQSVKLATRKLVDHTKPSKNWEKVGIAALVCLIVASIVAAFCLPLLVHSLLLMITPLLLGSVPPMGMGICHLAKKLPDQEKAPLEESLKHSIKILEYHQEKLNTLKDKLNQDLNTLKDKPIDEEMAKLEAAIEQKERELTELEQQLQKLEGEKTRSKLEAMKTDNSEEVTSLDSLLSTCKKLANKRSQLNRNKANITRETDSLKQQKQELEKTKDLLAKLVTLTQQAA